MELYVKVSFWFGVGFAIVRLAEMAGSEWPKKRPPKTLGEHTAETLLGIALCIWAGLVLWR